MPQAVTDLSLGRSHTHSQRQVLIFNRKLVSNLKINLAGVRL